MQLLTPLSSSGDPYLIKDNHITTDQVDVNCNLNRVNLTAVYLAGWEDLVNRSGSGVICALTSNANQDIQIYVNGVLFLEYLAPSSASQVMNYIDADADSKMKYIPYTKSIHVRVRNNMNGSFATNMYHLITGEA